MIQPAVISKQLIIRLGAYTVAVILIFGLSLSLVALETSKQAFDSTQPHTPRTLTTPSATPVLEPFPVSVRPREKVIVEHPDVDTFIRGNLSAQSEVTQQPGWLQHVAALFYTNAWYQQLASPVSRMMVVFPGERKEEVAQKAARTLGWSNDEVEIFLEQVSTAVPGVPDGVVFPGYYVFPTGSTPETVASAVTAQFYSEVVSRYDQTVATLVPLKDAVIIASLLEREAYDFTDMREISGIIWNRLFIDMKLQLDASLQYARGSKSSETKWWPVPVPKDKFIDSPYNTYQHHGLPPGPISNPSLEALVAALNPIETSCMFYFHDDYSRFHCSETYEEHVALLKEHFGQGR